MSNIYKYFALVFLFHSNDHKPIHVHVSSAGTENKLEFVYDNGKLVDVVVKRALLKRPLSPALQKEAVRFAKIKHKEIVEKWTEFYVLKKKVKCEVITKKI